jgi:hypothetical protein
LTLAAVTGTFLEGENIVFSGAAEGLRLTAFSLSVGVKGGLNRLPAAKRF